MWARRISTIGGLHPPPPVKEETKTKKVRARAKGKKLDTSQLTSNDQTVIEAEENEEENSPTVHVF